MYKTGILTNSRT